MPDVTSVTPLGDFRLKVGFADGRTGEYDMKPLIERGGVFEPLLKVDFFDRVSVSSDVGAVCWPNGADVCPDVLYAEATGQSLPSWAEGEHSSHEEPEE